MDGLCQLVLCVDDINLVGININNIMRSTEAVIFASQEVLLQVITEEIKYVFMNIEQNSRQSRNTETGNEFLENVSMFRHIATKSKIRIACIKT
jgi:hypothetical protein